MKKAIIIAAALMMGSAIAASASNEIAQAPKDCSGLTTAEQQFATLLNATNKSTFCGKFSSSQRSKAMSWTGKKDENGKVMSPDDAVKKVASSQNNGY